MTPIKVQRTDTDEEPDCVLAIQKEWHITKIPMSCLVVKEHYLAMRNHESNNTQLIINDDMYEPTPKKDQKFPLHAFFRHIKHKLAETLDGAMLETHYSIPNPTLDVTKATEAPLDQNDQLSQHNSLQEVQCSIPAPEVDFSWLIRLEENYQYTKPRLSPDQVGDDDGTFSQAIDGSTEKTTSSVSLEPKILDLQPYHARRKILKEKIAQWNKSNDRDETYNQTTRSFRIPAKHVLDLPSQTTRRKILKERIAQWNSAIMNGGSIEQSIAPMKGPAPKFRYYQRRTERLETAQQKLRESLHFSKSERPSLLLSNGVEWSSQLETVEPRTSSLNPKTILLFMIVIHIFRKLFLTRKPPNDTADVVDANADITTINTVLVRTALMTSDATREPDLRKRVRDEWSPLLPILDTTTSKHRHGCHLLIRKLTRLTATGSSTDRLLGLIEDWMTSVLQSKPLCVENESSTYQTMLKDLYLFLQVEYELPANAVITLLPFVMANANVEDLYCEQRLGKMIFAAEAKLGQFFEEKSAHIAPKTENKSTVKAVPPKLNATPRSPNRKGANVSFTSTNTKESAQPEKGVIKNIISHGKSAATTNKRPLILDSIDVINRGAENEKSSTQGSIQSKTKTIFFELEKAVQSEGKSKDKLPAHGSTRRRSPKSKDVFVYHIRYLEATKKLKMRKQNP